MSLRPVTISLVFFSFFYLILTVEVHLNDTQDISNPQLPYKRCERKIYYNIARQAVSWLPTNTTVTTVL